MTETWTRPARAVLLVATVYVAWQAISGTGLLLAAWRHIDDGLIAWSMLGLLFGVPLTVVLAALGRRIDGAEHGQRPPAPGLWLVAAFGLVFGAHWLAVSLWPLGLLVAYAQSSSSRTLEHALWGLGSWVLAGAGVAVGIWAVRALRRRIWPAAARPLGARWLPVSALLGIAYACSCGSAAVLGVGWLSGQGWNHGAGSAAVAAWLFAGAAATVAAAGVTELWRRGGALGRHVSPHVRLEIAGGVLAAHWVPVFVLGLSPVVDRDPDLQWTLLGASFVLVLLGTWLWGLGRATVDPGVELATA